MWYPWLAGWRKRQRLARREVRRRTRPEIEALEERRLLSTLVVSPGASIQQALDAAQAGDTVRVHAGTYSERLTFHHGGVTLEAFPGERPLLTGANGRQAFQVLIPDVSDVTVRGFEIANNKVKDGSGIRVRGSGSHITIPDNFIHDLRGKDAMGITVYGTEAAPISDLTIARNIISRCQPAQSEALTLNGNVTDFQVLDNLVTDVNNIGIDLSGRAGLSAVRLGLQPGWTYRSMLLAPRSSLR
jgi:polygalacturonase